MTSWEEAWSSRNHSDAKALREAGDRLINEQKVEIVLLAGIEPDKQPAYLVMVKGAPVKASELMKQVATVSGSRGGGRPDLAQQMTDELRQLL